MRLLPSLPIALVMMLSALTVTGCKNLVIRPPGEAAGYYASPNGPGER
jgi:hypothetical protein